MDFYSQTDKAQPSDVNSTSGDVQPKYIKVPSTLIHTADEGVEQNVESEDLTREEEEKFYNKVMKTTLL